MSAYIIRRQTYRNRDPWVLWCNSGAQGQYVISTFKSRSEAIAVARVLAGWRGSVVVEA